MLLDKESSTILAWFVLGYGFINFVAFIARAIYEWKSTRKNDK